MQPEKEMIDSDEKINSDSKWHMLVPDLIRLVFERLDFAAFHKTRSISLHWYSTAELYMRQNPTPWIILFSSNYNDVSLFDPHHKKNYLVRDLGFDFHKSRCLANSGSWFLMLDHRTNLYILNLFTRQRIRLPSLETINGGQIRFERVNESDFVVTFGHKVSISKSNKVRIRKAVLWVDERCKDYLVVWNFDSSFAYHKRGDNNESWKVIKPLKNEGCDDMVFKDGKLYRLGGGTINVFDFYCGDSPVVCASFKLSPNCRGYLHNNLAVTLSREVLFVGNWGGYSFHIYKMDPESSEWSGIGSLGDEALLWDQGVTVEAKDGVMKNCIYLRKYQLNRQSWARPPNDDNGICIYNYQTHKQVQMFQHLSDSSSSLPFKDARWFFPTFGGKWLL